MKFFDELPAHVYIAREENGYYVGSTQDIVKRRKQHSRKGREVLDAYETTRGQRYEDEQEFIEFCEATGLPLTNKIKTPGHSSKAYKPSWKRNRHNRRNRSHEEE